MTVGNILGAIGYYFFGPFGYLVGSMIGNALFPPGGNGPRLEVGFTKSEYGRALPIIYGTIAVPGTVIAAHTWVVAGDSGGKGDEPTPDVAYGSFAVALCEGGDSIRLGKIYAGPEKRLVWDGLAFEGGATVTFYNGAETQMPDPLMESFFGVGNVPAYRGTAYIVIANFPLAKDGNRLPFLTVEVGRIDASAAPADLGNVIITQVIRTATQYMVFYTGSYSGVIIRSLADNTLYKHYSTLLNTVWTTSFDPYDWFYDEPRQTLVHWDRSLMAYETMPIASGVRTSHPISAAVGADSNLGVAIVTGCLHNGSYVFGAKGSSGVTNRVSIYGMNPDTHTPAFTYAADSSGTFEGPFLSGPSSLYGFSYPQTLRKFTVASGSTPVDLGAPAPLHVLTSAKAAVDPTTGYIWSAYQASLTSGSIEVHVNDPVTNALIYSTTITTTSYLIDLPWCFVPAIGALPARVYLCCSVPGGYDSFLRFNSAVPAYMDEMTTNYRGSGELMAMEYNPVTLQLMAFRRYGWVSFSDTPGDPTTANFFVSAGVQEPDNFYLGQADASLSPNGQPLSEVMLDLHIRAGLTEAQANFTALAGDIVDGYSLTDQMSVRDAATPLMPIHYFDLVESEGLVKAVKRGGTVTPIDDKDVGCFEQSDEPVDPMETTRAKENDLPKSLNVKYILAATNYSVAAKMAKRLIGSSGEERTMEAAMVLSDTKAQEVAEVNLHGAWIARITYKFTLTRKWSHLEPTDVVRVYGYTMRLTKTIQKDGIIECEATAEDAPLYTPNVVVTETPPSGGTVDTPATLVLEIA